ncbi:MAG: SlyX protein [Woeseiaceae bacterium]|nr:SlyX protein [Woeseiaceae bacterium]
MSEERLVDIEVKLAHQEQLLIDLDKVVTQQQSRIMQLEALCNRLIERVRSFAGGASDAPHDDKPPHY